jgi:hypothetical protein
MMEMIAAYLQQTPVSSCNGRKHGKQRLALLRASVHKMIPSFSIMGISREYEDMAKKSKATQVIWKIKENNSLVLHSNKPVKITNRI